ncbi:hypothetical protein L873DRAFT_25102 [Choiromyces venosus 120613-1]|uniref:Uncharacterized protein n=1 Tax=Choiromyces venosus 120613-1 TaxID=1336337 RepID=A0A3N4K6W1_9PEZI|nr:hypothetical protein L873DRAFT_25102 [Choiromyces venosus 120613-1]
MCNWDIIIVLEYSKAVSAINGGTMIPGCQSSQSSRGRMERSANDTKRERERERVWLGCNRTDHTKLFGTFFPHFLTNCFTLACRALFITVYHPGPGPSQHQSRSNDRQTERYRTVRYVMVRYDSYSLHTLHSTPLHSQRNDIIRKTPPNKKITNPTSQRLFFPPVRCGPILNSQGILNIR